ncbi:MULTISPECIES: hypothetical protein [Rhizobium]|jgi:hypothetical protein|uniref:Glycosyltransferase n=1 Tax=Rhizobium lusitanum TaxID=293958 RepID=A0A1C3V261_9HYPH|nr:MULTISPECIES: hypothetical protein [Rhizobium]NRP87885.1 hypothetical protein [Ensifer adhaerens]NKJ04672.1 hypothetical protein [Rhizobium sp. SG741]NKJ37760.1 hypothetical protein [Rhizobium sp. SG570]NTJ10265.1 hypothetical protein [Rhizobium lusitanum]SCB21860.1 hypothetical protein GA0061101_10493 [Rhizobium lusitanum]
MTENRLIFIATPCFGGLVAKDYMQSIFSLMQVGAQAGIQLTLALLGNDALITRSRNTLVSSFLNDTAATHMLFIDADISFEPEQVMRLLNADKDVVAAMYPIKDYDWDSAARATTRTGESLNAAALHYVGTPLVGQSSERDGDFVSAIYAGTGMLLIKREVIKTMTAAYPDLRYSAIHAYPGTKRSPATQYALFECMIEEGTGIYLSEDFAFCHRWRALGGKIWLDTASKLTHTGAHRFVGNTAPRY